MDAKHTLGPLFVLNDEPLRIKIVDAQGVEVFSESRHSWSSSDKTAEDSMQARGFTFRGADPAAAILANERQLADAYLRAAAPEMLEALEPFAKFACDVPCECNNCRARAAIAKAKGE